MNPHGLPLWILSPARLPVPPLSRFLFSRLYHDLSISDLATLPRTLPSMERGQLGGPFLQHGRVDDGVPPIDRLGLVSHHRHGRRPRHPRPLEVAHSRPSEVVGDAARDTSLPAGSLPRPPEVTNRLPVPVEYPGDDSTTRPLTPALMGTLSMT